jgi:MoxR-like ATPase
MTPANGNGSGNATVAALQGLRADLVSRFPEREAVVDGALCALLAGEHVLLLGPPGTAKSALVRALAHSLQGLKPDHRKRLEDNQCARRSLGEEEAMR